MSKAQLLKAIKQAKSVHAYVQLTENEEAYIKVTKSDAVEQISRLGDGQEFNAVMRDGKYLYLN